MKRITRAIKGFLVGFIVFPFMSLIIGLEFCADWFVEKVIKNKRND
jgi:hypothetical protein